MAEASDAAQQDMGALSGRFGYVSEKTVAVVTGGELMVVLAKQDGAFAGFVGRPENSRSMCKRRSVRSGRLTT